MRGIIMQKIKWKFTFAAFFILIAFANLACKKKKDDASQEAGYTGVAAVALTNIEGVQSNYEPDSMQVSSGTSSSVISPLLADFCEGKNFYACQPKLVKLYVAISKSYLRTMKLFLAGFSQGLSNIQDGDANDSVAINDRTSIAYSKTSATQYSILARAGADSYFYFSSNANIYNLQIDFSKIPAADRSASDPTQGKVTVTLTYTDNTHWTLSLYAYDFACNESDPKAPERIKITIHKNDTIWNGKAMLANSRSMKGDATNNPVTCTSNSIDVANSSNFYTEFVGDATATKASVYLMKRDVTATLSTDYAANYALNNLCASYYGNFAGSELACNTALAIALGESMANYINPFCNLKGTNLATWGDTCSANSAAVSSASFDDSEVTWIAPASLHTTTFTLPTTAQ
jgi:hypothetical protein